MSVLEALAAATKLLDTLDVAYYLGGSLASSIAGEPRSTNDIDIVLRLDQDKIETLAGVADDDWYMPPPERIRQAVITASSFNLVHLPTMVKVDLFVAGARHDRDFLRRRQVRVSENLVVWVAAPEDIVLRKLDWYRKTEASSDRQWRDIVGVLKAQRDVMPALDLDYLRSSAAEDTTLGLLERALQEAGF